MPPLAALAAAIPTWVAPAAMIAGTVVSGVSSIASGVQQSAAYKSQAEAAKYNQQAAWQSAAATEEAAKYEEERQRREGVRLLGAQKAAFGASGMTMEGTPLELMAQTAEEQEREILASRYNYGMQASRYRSQANFYGFEAERNQGMAGYPVTAGIMGAGTSLLSTAGKIGLAYQGKNQGKKNDGLAWAW